MKKTTTFVAAFVLSILILVILIVFGGRYLKFSERIEASERGGVVEVAAEEAVTEKTSSGALEHARKPPVQKQPVQNVQTGAKTSFCLSCHGEVESFHYPAKTSAIDNAKQIKPRICISCHGQKVHEVHKNKLDTKAILCNTCHLKNGEIYKPKAEKGMLLVCELCHAKGNYIEIHIKGNILKDAPLDERWIKSYNLNNDCSVCHFGEYSFIHRSVLGRWRERIENITRLEKVEPLNISYL